MSLFSKIKNALFNWDDEIEKADKEWKKFKKSDEYSKIKDEDKEAKSEWKKFKKQFNL